MGILVDWNGGNALNKRKKEFGRVGALYSDPYYSILQLMSGST
jgi:hypothetical protein